MNQEDKETKSTKAEEDISPFMGVDYDKLEEKMRKDGASEEEITMTMSLVRLLRSRE